jgi:hypothetical protein
MANIVTGNRSARAATDYIAALVERHLSYPVALAPANDHGQPSRRIARRTQLTPGEINERLLALLCMCLAGAISVLWLVTNLRG